jgi:hypothetical protein
MIKKSKKFQPKGASEDWIGMNYDLLYEEHQLVYLNEGKSIPLEVAYLILDEHGFVEVEDVTDTMWIQTTANTAYGGRFSFDKEFTNVIDRMIAEDKEKYLTSKCPSLKQLSANFAETKQGKGNTRPITSKAKQLMAKWGKKYVKQLATKVLRGKINFCKVCQNNDTIDMQFMSCCGYPIHYHCMQAQKTKFCPCCMGTGTPINDILLKDKAFISEEEFEQNLKDKKKSEDEIKMSSDKEIGRISKSISTGEIPEENVRNFLENAGLPAEQIDEMLNQSAACRMNQPEDEDIKEGGDSESRIINEEQHKEEEQIPEENQEIPRPEQKKKEHKKSRGKKK